MPPTPTPHRDQIESGFAAQISTERDTDIYLYAGGLYFPYDRVFDECVRQSKSRKNALLFLGTFGGSADTAYRVARCLQTKYRGGTVTLVVIEFCKSAGTLLAIGANELVVPDNAELGPLDVQIAKDDALSGRVSGLTPVQALNTLREEAFKCFEKCFVDVIHNSRGRIATRTASVIAVRMTVGLFRPIYEQIEPMRMGEYGRSLLVADDYGMRLNRMFSNLRDDGLARLIAGYPSHEFVIDRDEAKSLFSRVRPPTEAEQKMVELLSDRASRSISGDSAQIECLSEKAAPSSPKDSARDKPEITDRAPPAATGRKNGPASATGQSDGKPARGRRGSASRTTASANRNGLPK